MKGYIDTPPGFRDDLALQLRPDEDGIYPDPEAERKAASSGWRDHEADSDLYDILWETRFGHAYGKKLG